MSMRLCVVQPFRRFLFRRSLWHYGQVGYDAFQNSGGGAQNKCEMVPNRLQERGVGAEEVVGKRAKRCGREERVLRGFARSGQQ